MAFGLLDDKFHANQKIVEVGNAGAGLYARALSYCADQLTDGFLPLGWAREIGTVTLCKKLCAAGLWISVKPGDGPFVYIRENDSYTVHTSGGFTVSCGGCGRTRCPKCAEILHVLYGGAA